jgi:acyl carrier protein
MWGRGDQGDSAGRPLVEDVAVTTGDRSPTVDQIRAWLVGKLAEILEVKPDQIDSSVPIERLGVDSASAIDLVAAIESRLGRDFSPTLAYEHPSVDALATFLVNDLAGAP